MKNSIKYYYGINVSNLEQKEDNYFFDNYILRPCYKYIDIDLYNYLIANNYYLHKIIYNQNNEYITMISNKPYILLKIEKKHQLSLDYIKKYNIIFKYKKNPSWSILWENKIDFYEKNIANVKDEKIYNSFNYFVGISENAIKIFKTLNLDNNFSLCHIRFNHDFEFYDPLNIVVDYKERDIAEYIKKEFYYNNKYYLDTIRDMVRTDNYNNVMLFFVRMLYPSIYFDQYDNYIKNEDVDYTFYNKIESYDQYLKEIYHIIKKKYNTLSISWLE